MTSSTINVNTGIPQGWVLGPLLVFLLTHDHVDTHSSNNIIEFCWSKLKEVPGWRIHLHHYQHKNSREFSIRFLVVHITVLDTSRQKDQDSFSSSSEDWRDSRWNQDESNEIKMNDILVPADTYAFILPRPQYCSKKYGVLLEQTGASFQGRNEAPSEQITAESKLNRLQALKVWH